MTNIDYRRAFKIACDLLNGDVFYGVDTDKIFELMMQKDGVVSSRSYEEYILNHLQELDQGQYASNSEIPTGSTTKDNLGVDAISRQAINGYIDYILSHGMGKKKSFDFIKKFVTNLPPVTPQEPILDKIRAEIDKIYEREGSSFDCLNALDELKEFIDKYKAESEKA